MTHIQPDLLQRFLADEADLMEQDAVREHLACCEDCAVLMVQMTAEDDSLTRALRLDEEESAWIAGLDLTAPVLRHIRPWYREPALWIVGLLVLLPGVVAFSAFTALASSLLESEGPVGTGISLLRSLLPALWRLNLYLADGGLLRSLWPVLLLAAAVSFWRFRSAKKEAKSNA